MESEDGNYEESGHEGRGRGGGRDRGGMGMKPDYFLPKPVKVGDEVEVDVISVASKGDGIAKKDGFVIFIKGAFESLHRAYIRKIEIQILRAPVESIGLLEGSASLEDQLRRHLAEHASEHYVLQVVVLNPERIQRICPCIL